MKKNMLISLVMLGGLGVTTAIAYDPAYNAAHGGQDVGIQSFVDKEPMPMSGMPDEPVEGGYGEINRNNGPVLAGKGQEIFEPMIFTGMERLRLEKRLEAANLKVKTLKSGSKEFLQAIGEVKTLEYLLGLGEGPVVMHEPTGNVGLGEPQDMHSGFVGKGKPGERPLLRGPINDVYYEEREQAAHGDQDRRPFTRAK